MMKKNELNKTQDESNLILFCFREENTKDDFKLIEERLNSKYQYSITDHQGNTRVVFTSATQTVTAGFETANQTTEQSNFSNYQTGKINTLTPTNPNATAGNSAYYLNGGYAGQVGITKSYKVFPGDVVAIQAKATYNTPSGTAANYTSFVGSLLTAFNLAAPAGGETGTPAAGVNAFGGWEIGPSGDESKGDAMKVFVTIILFDKNYNFIDVSYKAAGASGSLFSASYTVKEAGYAYLYISNEHPYLTDVYFDEVAMSYTPSQIIQGNEYYPFGLQTVNSWTRDNTAANNFLYNQANELNTTTGIYDTFFRGYDPALGRFMQIDPLSTRYASQTPYNYAFNNPILFNDPWGADPYSDIWDIIERIWRNTPTDDGMGMWTSNGGTFGGGGASGSYHYYQGDGTGNYSEIAGEGSHYNSSNGPGGKVQIVVSGNTANIYTYQVDPAVYNSAGERLQDQRTTVDYQQFSIGSNGRSMNSGDKDAWNNFWSGKELEYSQGLDLALSGAGNIAGAFETGGAVALSELTKGGKVVQLADKAKYLGALKYGKILGNVGIGLTAAVAVHEFATGHDDTHTWVDLGVTALGVGALVVGGTAAALFVVAGGLVYGIWSMAGGSDWVDENWGYNTNKGN